MGGGCGGGEGVVVGHMEVTEKSFPNRCFFIRWGECVAPMVGSLQPDVAATEKCFANHFVIWDQMGGGGQGGAKSRTRTPPRNFVLGAWSGALVALPWGVWAKGDSNIFLPRSYLL